MPASTSGDSKRYTSWTWFNFWKENKDKYPFTASEASQIINRFCRRCHDLILENPDGVRFPFGTLMVAGVQGDFKNKIKSTKDLRIDYRNLKTNKVVYTVRYIYGLGRGRVFTGLLWKFRTTVPLRQRIKQMIDEGKFRHWYVFDKFKDVPAFGVPTEYVRYDKARSRFKAKKLNQGS